MEFSGLEGNELAVAVAPGETLFFDLHFLRSPKFRRDVTPHFWEAVVARLMAGKLWEPHLTGGPDGDIVLLSGPEPSGCFHVVKIAPGKTMFVRLRHLVAYAFNGDGRFSSCLNLVDPVRWLIGATSSAYVRGPASLVFYGRSVEEVSAESGEECFADQLYAFSAESPFRVSGYLPQGVGFWADLINTTSTTVNMTFQGPVHLVKTTLRQSHSHLLANLWRLLFVSIFLGWVVQRVVTSQ